MYICRFVTLCICWDAQSEKTGLRQFPIVSSVFNTTMHIVSTQVWNLQFPTSALYSSTVTSAISSFFRALISKLTYLAFTGGSHINPTMTPSTDCSAVAGEPHGWFLVWVKLTPARTVTPMKRFPVWQIKDICWRFCLLLFTKVKCLSGLLYE